MKEFNVISYVVDFVGFVMLVSLHLNHARVFELLEKNEVQ